MARTPRKTKKVETLTHGEASRKNIPTAEYQAVMEKDDRSPIRIAWPACLTTWRGEVRERAVRTRRAPLGARRRT